MGAGELEEETSRKLAETTKQLAEARSALSALREENEKLRNQIAATGAQGAPGSS